MVKYNLRFKRSVAKDLRKIPKQDVKRILNQFDALADNPRVTGCIKLTGLDCFRVRVGIYRIVYEIRDAELVVLVIKVGHRAVMYK